MPFQLKLIATGDPRVFNYCPNTRPDIKPPTIRIHFSEPPTFSGPFCIVIGTVSRIEPDDRKRRSGHLGVVVISDARLVPPDPR